MIVWLFTTLAAHELLATLGFVAVFAVAYAIRDARRRTLPAR